MKGVLVLNPFHVIRPKYSRASWTTIYSYPLPVTGSFCLLPKANSSCFRGQYTVWYLSIVVFLCTQRDLRSTMSLTIFISGTKNMATHMQHTMTNPEDWYLCARVVWERTKRLLRRIGETLYPRKRLSNNSPLSAWLCHEIGPLPCTLQIYSSTYVPTSRCSKCNYNCRTLGTIFHSLSRGLDQLLVQIMVQILP